MLTKRTLKIGEYDTAAKGWTLAGLSLGHPTQKTHYVARPGGDGSWDLSTALTDGLPRYNDRTLTATLECSEGTRVDRQALISEMINQLDGLEWSIVPPDHPEHYLTGRVHVEPKYSDYAHAAVALTCTCRPWLYSAQETVLTLQATSEELTARLHNAGRLAMVPKLTITGSVTLTYGTATLQLTTDGDYEWPELLLTPGAHDLKYSGAGTLVITYREAVLL